MTTGKTSSYLRWSAAGVLSLSILLNACSQPKPQSPILIGLYEFTKFQLAPKTKAVVIVADNSCMECNRELSEMMTGYLTRKDIQFVVSAHESAINLSRYIDAPRKDIIFDRSHSLTDNGIVKGSTVLFMNGKDVDTALQIDARKIEEQFRFLRLRLDNNQLAAQ